MSSSAARRIAAAVLIAATVSFTAPTREPVPRAPSKPSVTLLFDIEADLYRGELDDTACADSCDKLRAVLREDLLRLLGERYPFLNWVRTATTDTLEIALATAPGFRSTQLEFRMRGPVQRMTVPKKAVPFEEYSTTSQRQDEGWAPESLRIAWLQQLEEQTFTPTHPDLVSDVFGRVPVKPEVRFKNEEAVALITPTSDEMERVRPTPWYEIRVRVVDPVKVIDDEADVPLVKCKQGGSVYSCPIEQLNFANDTIRAPTLGPFIARNVLREVIVVRLSRFEAASVGGDLSRGPTGVTP